MNADSNALAVVTNGIAHGRHEAGGSPAAPFPDGPGNVVARQVAEEEVPGVLQRQVEGDRSEAWR